MNRDFDTYYSKVYKPGGQLYHEWLFEQMFGKEDIDPKLAGKIRLAIHESLISGLNIEPIVKIAYIKELTSRVVITSGEYKGKKISSLPHHANVKKMLTNLKEKTKDPVIRQACSLKLSVMFEARREAILFSDSKLHNIRRFTIPKTK